jgi:hypothetical protein
MSHIANFLIKQSGKKISLKGGQEFPDYHQKWFKISFQGFLVKSLNENTGKILPYPGAF